MYYGLKLFGQMKQKFSFSEETPVPMFRGRKEQPTNQLTLYIPTVKFGGGSVMLYRVYRDV